MNQQNPVNPIDTTNMSIFGISIAGLTTALQMHQWYVAGGMLLILIASAWWYHAQGSPSVPAGTLPVTVPNPTNATLATPTTPITVTSPVAPTVTVQPTTPSAPVPPTV